MSWTVLLVIICILHTRYVKEIKNGEVVIGNEKIYLETLDDLWLLIESYCK